MTHICVVKLIIIGSDNGLSPDRRQAIIWTNVGLLSIGSLRTYFNENLICVNWVSLEFAWLEVVSCFSTDRYHFKNALCVSVVESHYHTAHDNKIWPAAQMWQTYNKFWTNKYTNTYIFPQWPVVFWLLFHFMNYVWIIIMNAILLKLQWNIH